MGYHFCRIRVFSIWGALIILVSSSTVLAQSQQRDRTKETSLEYLNIDAQRDYDALEKLYATDATFFDPTGEVFQGGVSQGVISGGAEIAELQRSWGLTGVEFNPNVSFYVGQYALHRGVYKAQFEGSESWYTIPFVTVHRIVDGKVKSRMDVGEYIQSFGMGTGFDDVMSSTNQVSKAYLKAYLDEDFEAQASLMEESIEFQDPTASVFGPDWGAAIVGRDALIQNRKRVFESISDFNFEVEDEFVSNHHAVFMGYVMYTAGDGQHFKQPAVFVIEVREGKVTRHWDFVDYSVGPSGN